MTTTYLSQGMDVLKELEPLERAHSGTCLGSTLSAAIHEIKALRSASPVPPSEPEALRIATDMAVRMAEEHYPGNPDWKVDTELIGVLWQISNMLAGMSRSVPSSEPVGWRYRYNGQWYFSQNKSFALQGFDLQPLYAHPSPGSVEAGRDGGHDLAFERILGAFSVTTLSYEEAIAIYLRTRGILCDESEVLGAAIPRDWCPPGSVPPSHPRDDDVRDRVKECRIEHADSGHWRPCSGCYDTEDGHPIGRYPHSKAFGCVLGSGCSECGGTGAIWDTTDYADMATYMLKEDHPRDEVVEALRTLGSSQEWKEKREALLRWTGSACIAGDEEFTENDLSKLYSFLCGLIGWLGSVETAISKLESSRG